jgi:hypothetical protein
MVVSRTILLGEKGVDRLAISACGIVNDFVGIEKRQLELLGDAF